MLHLLYGPAASGKTDLLMGRIRTAVAARTPGQVLLVPEQYSHEAERALCAACGDSLSLYAEVLSFTGLARRVAAETGAGEAPLLDQGGRLLCMALGALAGGDVAGLVACGVIFALPGVVFGCAYGLYEALKGRDDPDA